MPFLLLDLPSRQRRIRLPFVPGAPAPTGRKLPNGTMVGVDHATPSLFYKFSPWANSTLAFNEADIYATLRDAGDIPGIVRLLGVSGTPDHFVRILERSHAGALNRFLFGHARGDPRLVAADLARALLAQIADAMASLHAVGVVHRDLKAENVLVFADPDDAGEGGTVRVKVSDFDRAVELPQDARIQTPVGSLFHMAPELLAGTPYDRQVDVYAFGILMFEVAHGGGRAYPNVATGMPGSLSPREFTQSVLGEQRRPAWTHEDQGLRRIAERCWASDPAQRPAFEQLAEWLRPMAGTASHVTTATDNRHRDDSAGPVGIAASVGRQRDRMEDAACVIQTPDGALAGVFDGLRGHRCSEFVARRLLLALSDAIADHPDAIDDALERSFIDMDACLQALQPPVECGSTATVAVLRPDTLDLAWLGDSPALLVRNGATDGGLVATPLIDKHHPGRSDEAARIVAHGGIVDRNKTWLDNGESAPFGPPRVFVPDKAEGGIAISRGFGLFAFKSAIGRQPERRTLERRDDDRYLVIGTDGVFDVLPMPALVSILATSASAQAAADALIEAVLHAGAPDNASVVVIDLSATPTESS